MAWDFDGVDNYAKFTMSATLQGAAGGPMTMAALVHLDAATDGAFIHTLSGATSFQFMEVFSTYNYGTTAGARTGPAAVTGAWYWVIISKDTGNVAPEYTIFPLATMTPTSGTLTGGGVTLGNGTAPGASGFIQVGRFGTSATEYVNGRIAATVIWTAFKNQAAREALTTWALTLASSGIQWGVRFDALTTRTDATGNGGGETARFGTTGITLAADPSGAFFGGTGATVTPSAVAGVGTVPAPTVSAASTVTPAAVAGVGTVPAPTVSGGARVVPAAVTGVGAVPAPAVSTGVTLTPAAVAGVGTVPAPTVSAGSRVVPAAVQGVGTIPAPTLSAGSQVVATAVTGVGTVPAPSLAAGATVTATAVTGVGTIPAPSVSAGGSASINASTVQGVGTVPAPVMAAGSQVTPATVSGVGVIPAPTVTVSVAVTVSTVAGVGVVPAPTVTVSTGVTITVATVQGSGNIPGPTVSAGGSSPTPVLTHVKDLTPLPFVVADPVPHVRAAPLVHVGS